jgi:hypothetical protein
MAGPATTPTSPIARTAVMIRRAPSWRSLLVIARELLMKLMPLMWVEDDPAHAPTQDAARNDV